jgi:hypothetical protein
MHAVLRIDLQPLPGIAGRHEFIYPGAAVARFRPPPTAMLLFTGKFGLLRPVNFRLTKT